MFDNLLFRAGRACPADSLLLTAYGVNMQEMVNFRLPVRFMWGWEKTTTTGQQFQLQHAMVTKLQSAYSKHRVIRSV